MTGEMLKAALRRGRTVYGTMLTGELPVPWLGVVRELELDFAVIDLEHAFVSESDVAARLHVLALLGCVPFVRVPTPDPAAVARVIDGGAHGVLIPYCEHAAEVADCVRAARYRPLKGERLAEHVRGKPLPAKTARAIHELNRNVVVVVGVESGAAVERLDDLVTAEAVDAVFVGTQDLTFSLGHPNELEHPAVVSAFDHVIATCRRHGVAVGIWPMPTELARHWIARGARFVLHSGDYHALRHGLRSDFDQLRAERARRRRR
jgi:4-hydroxy-2-oxoheptanedioate aldolase